MNTGKEMQRMIENLALIVVLIIIGIIFFVAGNEKVISLKDTKSDDGSVIKKVNEEQDSATTSKHSKYYYDDHIKISAISKKLMAPGDGGASDSETSSETTDTQQEKKEEVKDGKILLKKSVKEIWDELNDLTIMQRDSNRVSVYLRSVKDFAKLFNASLATHYLDLRENTDEPISLEEWKKINNSKEMLTSKEVQGIVRMQRAHTDGSKEYMTYVTPSEFKKLQDNYKNATTNEEREKAKLEASKHFTLEQKKVSGSSIKYDNSLVGEEVEEQIWWYLVKNLGGDGNLQAKYATAAIMGNWFHESTLNSYCVQGDYLQPDLMQYDLDYTEKVDNGTYSRDDFVNHGPGGGGYGLGQWTFYTRKEAMYDYIKGVKKASIGDLVSQLELTLAETFGIGPASEYVEKLSSFDSEAFLNSSSVIEATDYFFRVWENPDDNSAEKREVKAQEYFDKYKDRKMPTSSSTSNKSASNSNNNSDKSSISNSSSKTNISSSTSSSDKSNISNNSSKSNAPSSTKLDGIDNVLFIGDSILGTLKNTLEEEGAIVKFQGAAGPEFFLEEAQQNPNGRTSDFYSCIVTSDYYFDWEANFKDLKDIPAIYIILGQNTCLNNNRMEKMQQLVDKLQNQFPNTIIYINAVLPMTAELESKSFDNYNKSASSMNEELKQYCEESSNLIYSDTLDNYDPNVHSYDGLHPNSDGVEVLAKNIIENITTGKTSTNYTTSETQFVAKVLTWTEITDTMTDDGVFNGENGIYSESTYTYRMSVKEVYYEDYLSAYHMPFAYLWTMVVRGDDEFALDLADLIYGSEFTVTVHDNENITTTSRIEPYTIDRYFAKRDEEGNYILDKNKQPIFEVIPEPHQRVYTKKTVTNTIEPDLTLADTWCVKYEKVYELKQTLTSKKWVSKQKMDPEGKYDKNNGPNFVTVFNKNYNAKTNILSSEEWLFESLESNEDTKDMVDLTKFLLHKATGEEYGDYGEKEFDFNVFEPGKFTRISDTNKGNANWTGGFPRYYQYRNPDGSIVSWANNQFGSSNIGDAGCGACALAMAVTGLTGKTVEPPEIVDLLNSHGQTTFDEGNGVLSATIVTNEYGLSLEVVNKYARNTLDAALDEGKVCFFSINDSSVCHSSAGHYILCYKRDSNGYYVVESGHYYDTDTPYSFEDVMGACNNGGLVNVIGNPNGSATRQKTSNNMSTRVSSINHAKDFDIVYQLEVEADVPKNYLM